MTDFHINFRKIIFLVFFCFIENASATQGASLDELLTCESDRLTIRPLRIADYTAAKDIDELDKSYVTILDQEDETADFIQSNLNASEQALKAQGKENLTAALLKLPRGMLYYGVHQKDEDKKLVGVILLSTMHSGYCDAEKIDKPFLSTDVKFHKDIQGRGYASEAYNELFKHWMQLKLIPSNESSSDECAFSGIHALIHLTNKASLKCFTMNCGFVIGKLFGHRVDVYYPRVVKPKNPGEFPPFGPETLDQEVRSLFEKYLKKDADVEAAQKSLYQRAFQNLIAVEEKDISRTAEDESAFVVDAIGRYPELFKDLPKSFYESLQKLICEIEKDMPSIQDVPEYFKERFVHMKNGLRYIKEAFLQQAMLATKESLEEGENSLKTQELSEISTDLLESN